MPRYAITEKAGRFVAGQNNTGVGTVLTLTAKQAEHELRLGTLRRLDVPQVTAEPETDEALAETPAAKVSKPKKPSRIEPDLGADHATADDAG
ncbi:hypothetical protein [Antarctobacter heliothermus]|uniref:Uncharacterized protein n=1 Tax=Antarctobacter heliothermus TaxID=74033 RepID=A0A239GVF0_9RHOB|nr:hypothetical protein [Antarctobacter heliothermus]SNS73196.1 hypothetical protein SAMN04488078_102922 [Antarctobacter heliothermus]